jgi:nucleoid DNA-binding protein
MITPSIIRSLLEETTVSVSGFGTFCVKKLPAQIKDDIVYPPQNIIEFQYSKGTVGFDFVTKLSKWEQIRIDEAQEEVSKWIDLLENGLEHNKSIYYEELGTFMKNSLGSIDFQGVIHKKFNVEHEGFEPIVLPPKVEDLPPKTMNPPVKDKRIYFVKKAKKRDKFWFIFTILLAGITLSVVFLKDTIADYYHAVNNKERGNAVEKNIEIESEEYMNIEEEETVEMCTADKGSIDYEEVEEKNILPEKSNELYLPYQVGKYYVIAGSFLKEEDALRHIKQKNLDKYHAKLIVQSQNSRFRVSIGVFENEQDAERFAQEVDKNYWVLK